MSSSQQVESTAAAKRKTVLVVDDDPLVSAVILEMLAAGGYDAKAVPGAHAAEKMLSHLEPDIVLTDIVMPEGEGMEFILHLWRSENRLPIVAMSGNATGVLFLRASELLGVKATLRKPFTGEQLIEALHVALYGRS